RTIGRFVPRHRTGASRFETAPALLMFAGAVSQDPTSGAVRRLVDPVACCPGDITVPSLLQRRRRRLHETPALQDGGHAGLVVTRPAGRPASRVQGEPPWLSRKLQTLRGWGHDKTEPVLTGSA